MRPTASAQSVVRRHCATIAAADVVLVLENSEMRTCMSHFSALSALIIIEWSIRNPIFHYSYVNAPLSVLSQVCYCVNKDDISKRETQ